MINFFGKKIDLNDIYFVVYPDDFLKTKDGKDYSLYWKLKNMPDTPEKYNELAKLDPYENPNIVPLTGRELIETTNKNKYIPQFDKDFEATHRVMLMPAEAMIFYEHYRIYR